jgi:hypothetical protein
MLPFLTVEKKDMIENIRGEDFNISYRSKVSLRDLVAPSSKNV